MDMYIFPKNADTEILKTISNYLKILCSNGVFNLKKKKKKDVFII